MELTCCLENQTGQPVCICPYEDLLSLIGKKWAVLILRIIDAEGTAGYNTIYSKISGITPKAFGDKLKDLENSGLIERKIASERPFRTEYSLTSGGEQLLVGLKPFFSETKTETV